MRVTRGSFLRTALAASAGTVAFGTRAGAQDAGWAARVARLIEEYDAQGIHRTATDVDDRSAQWLAEQAQRAGADHVRLESFSIERIDVRSAYLEAEGRRAEGLPFFDGGFTGARGIRGRIAPAEYPHPVALLVLDAAAISSEGRSIEQLRRSAQHGAIVAVTEGAHPGLSPSNAQSFAAPYGVPVLQVAGEDQLFLRDLVARGVEVQVVADAIRTSARASNVVATVTGTRSSLPPAVVMTPRSGWWHCAAERGGGLACWIEAIRAAATARLERTVIAVASSGHELGHFGLDAFLDSRRALVKEAAAWIHLGANIGASGGAMRLQASHDRLEAVASNALSRAGCDVRQRVPRGTRPSGEARNIHDEGGRYVSMLGSGPFFHNLADRWPAAVDVAAVARFAEAVGGLTMAAASTSFTV